MKQIKKDRLLANDALRIDNLSTSLRKARKADDQLLQFELSGKKTTKLSTTHKEPTQVITQISQIYTAKKPKSYLTQGSTLSTQV